MMIDCLPLEGSGVNIVLTQVGQLPVLFDGGKDGVVIVLGVVDVLVLGLDGTSNENGPNLVGVAVVLALIPGQKNGSVLGKVLVGQEGLDEAVSPVGSIGQGGIVTIVVHVGATKVVC